MGVLQQNMRQCTPFHLEYHYRSLWKTVLRRSNSTDRKSNWCQTKPGDIHIVEPNAIECLEWLLYQDWRHKLPMNKLPLQHNLDFPIVVNFHRNCLFPAWKCRLDLQVGLFQRTTNGRLVISKSRNPATTVSSNILEPEMIIGGSDA